MGRAKGVVGGAEQANAWRVNGEREWCENASRRAHSLLAPRFFPPTHPRKTHPAFFCCVDPLGRPRPLAPWLTPVRRPAARVWLCPHRHRTPARRPLSHPRADAALWRPGRLRAPLALSGGYHPSLVPTPTIAQCSSIGSLDEWWVETMVAAASGGETRGGHTAGRRRPKSMSPHRGRDTRGGAHLSIVWPTEDQGVRSKK